MSKRIGIKGCFCLFIALLIANCKSVNAANYDGIDYSTVQGDYVYINSYDNLVVCVQGDGKGDGLVEQNNVGEVYGIILFVDCEGDDLYKEMNIVVNAENNGWTNGFPTDDGVPLRSIEDGDSIAYYYSNYWPIESAFVDGEGYSQYCLCNWNEIRNVKIKGIGLLAQDGTYLATVGDTLESPYIGHTEDYYISDSYLSLEEGDSEDLFLVNAEGAVRWYSSDNDIVSVDENGRITAKKAGSAIISAEYGEYEDSCFVLVEALKCYIDSDSVTINSNSIKINEYDTVQLVLKNAKGDITWKSSDKSIASVSADGTVTAKNPGKATITARYKGDSYKCKVTVKKDKTKYTLNKASAELYVDDTLQLTLKKATDTVKWTSSNKKVASVDSNGFVTAKKSGTADITATYRNKKYVCTVTVSKTGLDFTKISLIEGDSQKINLLGRSAVSYASANTKVAKVSKKGKITAVKKGTTKITVTDSTGKTYVCKVTVKENDFDFRRTKWNDSMKTVKAGEKGEFISEEKDTLGYKAELNGYDVFIIYSFDNDKLYESSYANKYSSAETAVATYTYFYKALEKKYGEAEISTVYNSVSNVLSDVDALELGMAIYFSEWKNKKTEITMMLMQVDGSYNDYFLNITYTDRNHKAKEEKIDTTDF